MASMCPATGLITIEHYNDPSENKMCATYFYSPSTGRRRRIHWWAHTKYRIYYSIRSSDNGCRGSKQYGSVGSLWTDSLNRGWSAIFLLSMRSDKMACLQYTTYKKYNWALFRLTEWSSIVCDTLITAVVILGIHLYQIVVILHVHHPSQLQIVTHTLIRTMNHGDDPWTTNKTAGKFPVSIRVSVCVCRIMGRSVGDNELSIIALRQRQSIYCGNGSLWPINRRIQFLSHSMSCKNYHLQSWFLHAQSTKHI